ncbi:NUDIX domain-containing protein [Limibaculum sp. FT325]|uniref:NUDIX domain-containing protein n=1 Tax=Thermohalobaculum sediminis TaxID=2939436 RepID=UPI0020C0DC64|nr:NUDIX domain-containing protein [Limibaculum sediminis]MCL5777755.1 NUDIX domain-containing protein [Limibaculum sediminis]
MRRIGEPWAPGRPYRDRRGAYVLALREGRLLAVWQEDELQLPGGGIDPGESPIRALHREVREETGWLIADPRRLTAFQRYAWLWDYGYWARKVQSVYMARAVRRLGPPSEPGHVPVWLSPDEAARALHVEGDREMVRLARRQGLI